LGAPIIRNVPDGLKEICQTSIDEYFPASATPSYEELFNCLQADRYVKEKKGEDVDAINSTLQEMQKWLFKNCDTQQTSIPTLYEGDKKLQGNRYYYHEMFVKKLLQRPNNLKRANLFTTNYDMAFDYALDNLGIHYINGFMGVHNRCFRPEVYDYDLYYPGQSVSGKVHRAEKVVKYFKLHGSLSWVSKEPSISNSYGINEFSLGQGFPEDLELVIYPCVSKKSFTLDLPYSELFRQFAHAINQPQSVLFCVGYSFNDEHINDIIYQALSIPSFTLIVANYAAEPTPNSPVEKLKALADRRIIILEETDTEQSTFTGFTQNVMSDLYEEEINIQITETMEKLYPNPKKNEDSE